MIKLESIDDEMRRKEHMEKLESGWYILYDNKCTKEMDRLPS